MTWRLRLHPLSTGWLDLARGSPLLDVTRAERDVAGELRTRQGAIDVTDTPTPRRKPER